MIVWDRGTWAPMGDPEAELPEGRVQVPPRGREARRRLDAGPAQARGRRARRQLAPDQGARPVTRDPATATILDERPESVKTGRRIEELLDAGGGRRSRPAADGEPVRPGALPGRREGAAARRRLRPQLATPVARAPDGDDWLHEIKFDGYRTLARDRRRRGPAHHPRAAIDWTDRYGDLAKAFAALPCREAVIDGEIVVQDAGRHQPLRRCCRTRSSEGRTQRAHLLRLRPPPPRRLRPRRGAADRAQAGAAQLLGRRSDRPRRSSSATTSQGERPGLLRAGVAARARGRRLQARGRPLPAGAQRRPGSRPRPADRGFRDRRLHRVRGRGRARRAGARRSGSTAGCAIVGKVGTGFSMTRDEALHDPARAAARQAGAGRAAARGAAQGHRLGAAGAARRGRVRQPDRGRHPCATPSIKGLRATGRRRSVAQTPAAPPKAERTLRHRRRSRRRSG